MAIQNAESRVRDAVTASPLARPLSQLRPFADNNFDLIRCGAALQVALVHCAEHLKTTGILRGVSATSEYLPGVPIFFFVSGFLISRSFETSGSIGQYFRNRALRIYPGLWVCLLISLASTALLGYTEVGRTSMLKIMAWLATQSTIAQFYNPDFLRHYGVGVLNGSLWTISVELQFYCLIPILYILIGKWNPARRNIALVLAISAFYMLNRAYVAESLGIHLITRKLLGVTFAPWFYMFLAGVLVQWNFDSWSSIPPARFWLFAAVVGGVLVLLSIRLGMALTANRIDCFGFISIAMLILGFAYMLPAVSLRLLRGNDVSYGIYIYHMPVINGILWLGYSGNVAAATCLLVAAGAGVLSWRFIERPALKRKRKALRTVV